MSAEPTCPACQMGGEACHNHREETSLPYAGTQGWSGSDTSKERAETEATDGTASERQQRTLRLMGRAIGVNNRFIGVGNGITVSELRDLTHMHHGQASSVLSVLHKEGRIVRLTERRDRCAVYVLPEYVDGRETAAHGRKKQQMTREEKRAYSDALARIERTEELGIRMATIETRAIRTLLDYIGRISG